MEVISELIDNMTDDSASKDQVISKVIQAKLDNTLREMINNCGDIVGAMVSSRDGLAWSEQLQEGLDQHRFAAMSSALLALSDTLISETHQSKPKNVFLESEAGNIFVMHAGTNLLLTTFTKATAQIGMPLAFSKKAADEISELKLNS